MPKTLPPTDDVSQQMTAKEPSGDTRSLKTLSIIIAAGWLGTNLGINVADLPLKFLLKDSLQMSPAAISAFFAIGAFTNYIKPLAGILTDAFPLFHTRRRHYLILSLSGSSILWLMLAVVPRTHASLLSTYALLYLTIVFTSTTLGGVMVEVAGRFKAEGRFTAQRIAMFRLGSLAGGPIGGWLASFPFGWAMGAASLLHLVLVPIYMRYLPEAPTAVTDSNVWNIAGEQLKAASKNRVLIGAGIMIFLIAVAPGFSTPLFFYQTDKLHFSKQFIGMLGLVGSASGLLAAIFYYRTCRRTNLRQLLVWSITIHALGSLSYLWYHDHFSAIWITGLGGFTATLAMLPVYDLAVRGTPRGSEALGYSVMMSVWNLTSALSDWTGSKIFEQLHRTFLSLVWINAGTTLIALAAIPFLPSLLLRQKDGFSD